MWITIIKPVLDFITNFLNQKKKSQAAWTFLLVLLMGSITTVGSAMYTKTVVRQEVELKSHELERRYVIDSLTMTEMKKDMKDLKHTADNTHSDVQEIYKYILKHSK